MATPRITIRRLEDNYCEFVLEESTPVVANALRRTLLADVPVLAIDEVVVVENSSVIFDEVLAHRLALVPLKVDEETYDVLLECYEEGKRDDCVAAFTLEVEAEKPVTVYSGHLKFGGFTSEFASLAAADVKPVSDLIPIVKLASRQKVVLEAYAKMGTGREHAKWQAVSVAAYKYYPVIRILGECKNDCKSCVEACPKGILSVENGKLKVTVEKLEECTMCRACEEACPDTIKVAWDDTKFLFKVEGIGILPVSKLVEIAMRRIAKRVDAFLSEVKRAVEFSASGAKTLSMD